MHIPKSPYLNDDYTAKHLLALCYANLIDGDDCTTKDEAERYLMQNGKYKDKRMGRIAVKGFEKLISLGYVEKLDRKHETVYCLAMPVMSIEIPERLSPNTPPIQDKVSVNAVYGVLTQLFGKQGKVIADAILEAKDLYNNDKFEKEQQEFLSAIREGKDILNL